MADRFDISIKPFAHADLAELRVLHALSFKALASGVHSQEQVFAYIRTMNSDEYGEDVLRSNMLCARDANGEMVATAGWLRMDKSHATARIRKVFVHPDLANSGLGRRMVTTVEYAAQSQGAEDYFVRANINAKGFYKRLGYAEIKPSIMPVTGGVNLPVMLMHKD